MLAPLDRFLVKYRIPVIVGTIGVAVIGAPLLYFLSFDFDPIHLRSTQTEAVSTLLDLGASPQVGINSVDIVMPSLDEADKAADRLRKMPEVADATTLMSFVPGDQDRKLELIKSFSDDMKPILERTPAKPPTDAENVAVLKGLAQQLRGEAGNATGPGADAARRLAEDSEKLAAADQTVRDKVQTAFVAPLKADLAQLGAELNATRVTTSDLPDTLKREWVTTDGKARVSVAPKGNTNSTDLLRNFARAMLNVYPNAIGGPISILESGKTVVRAFIEAGGYALLSIAILLWIVLRRFGDVLLTLVPLLLAGAVTLEITVLIGMPLNFANIIALPLLLGVGVAFKIYYIMAWRAGRTNLLQSSLTRAVIWSALTTATAFGSLWLSQHPGTSSMGKLLALSLVCTLCAAVLFQPALMGRPRGAADT
jgi:hopanoid biosynthesis associated RND transporter like protein HpnN